MLIAASVIADGDYGVDVTFADDGGAAVAMDAALAVVTGIVVATHMATLVTPVNGTILKFRALAWGRDTSGRAYDLDESLYPNFDGTSGLVDGLSTKSYVSVNESRVMAGELPGMTAFMAQSDDVVAGFLLAATIDIDSAMRFQGRKYDPTQKLMFPRVAYGPPVGKFGVQLPGPPALTPDVVVWDWDDAGQAPIVPLKVQQACLFQAAWLWGSPEMQARLEAIRSGLAAQGIATASETYLKPADFLPLGGMSPLCLRAKQLMEFYRIRSGAML